ncbi:hypothetical protein AVEN_167694-1 [Araneus ventricosus]|uniref:Uncharacterized protein n=1 Tax=Araneus ventricosus TaxID=182803 RepID=A0A4Y2SAP3_ARAVE|nr:hypothetical protein AVEN_167694-1 [Araneus ventricosus]
MRRLFAEFVSKVLYADKRKTGFQLRSICLNEESFLKMMLTGVESQVYGYDSWRSGIQRDRVQISAQLCYKKYNDSTVHTVSKLYGAEGVEILTLNFWIQGQ